MNESIFGTAINCMDGRTQLPVIHYLQTTFNVDFVDSITEPGPIKIITENKDPSIIQSIKHRMDISIQKHNSSVAAIVGHHDCAGNPVNKDIQINQIIHSVDIIKRWYPGLNVTGLWIDNHWEIAKIM